METRVNAFHNWLAAATPGQVYVYYTGFLAVDRGSYIFDPSSGMDYIPNEAINNLGRAAISAFEDDRVHLFQRKIHDRVYEYIAMKRREGGRNW